jgi:hypothetical protein
LLALATMRRLGLSALVIGASRMKILALRPCWLLALVGKSTLTRGLMTLTARSSTPIGKISSSHLAS